MRVGLKAGVVSQPARGGVQGAQEHEVARRVHQAHVEEGHLVAGRAVALVDLRRGGRRRRGGDDGRRERQMGDVARVAAVAGAAVGTAGWHAG